MTNDIRDDAQVPPRTPHEIPEWPELPPGFLVLEPPSAMAWLITEAEIARELKMTLAAWREVVVKAEEDGLPLRDPLFGHRHRDAVKDWLDRRHRLNQTTPAAVPPATGRGKF